MANIRKNMEIVLNPNSDGDPRYAVKLLYPAQNDLEQANEIRVKFLNPNDANITTDRVSDRNGWLVDAQGRPWEISLPGTFDIDNIVVFNRIHR